MRFDGNFTTLPERKGSWSTNALHGYLDQRARCIATLEEALRMFRNHYDVLACKEIDAAVRYMEGMKKEESYSNYAGMILLDCADHIEATNKGHAMTHSYDIVDAARKAGMGSWPGNQVNTDPEGEEGQ